MKTYPLNDHQREMLDDILDYINKEKQELFEHGLISIEERDAEMTVGFHPHPDNPNVIVVTGAADGVRDVIAYLYSEPRPIPKDPIFLGPEPVDRHVAVLLFRSFELRKEYRKIYGVESSSFDYESCHGVYMDAPSEMPAGSVQCYAVDSRPDTAYVAEQTTCRREQE